MSMPGFTAARSLVRAGRHRALFRDENGGVESTVIAADDPGGPGNVPIGYNRECKRVPVPHCEQGVCWTEYEWRCTLTPIRYSIGYYSM
jgi:hypothetical protein